MFENAVKTPIIALRGMNIIPGMFIHFDVSRKVSKEALEKVMTGEQRIFVTAQKDSTVDMPKLDDLYRVGVMVKIKQLIKFPNDQVRVMVEAEDRYNLISMTSSEPYLEGEIAKVENGETSISEASNEAMLRIIKELLGAYASENSKVNKEEIKSMRALKNINTLMNQIMSRLPLYMEQRQIYLETFDVEEQFELVNKYLQCEFDIAKVKKELQDKTKEKVDKNQKEYILREELKVIREELGDSDNTSDSDTFTEAVEKLEASEEIKDRIRKEIARYKNLTGSSSEGSVVRGYIETLIELPWDKMSKDNTDIKNAKKVLDEDHYGLTKVKERMLEFLAVRTFTENSGKSPIICLVGPPGTGKTSIAKSVARALDKEYVRICLGGVRDEAEIRGHRKTYVGAMSGRIATGIKQAGVKNPLMLLDEIDKLGNDYKGDPASALLEVLDSEQNSKFVDHYIEVPIDLSQVLFIATANSLQTIPRPLLDRMEIIEVSSYTYNEKEHIAEEYLIPKMKKQHGLTGNKLSINKNAVSAIVSNYTREAGVRSLERKIAELCRKATLELLETGKKSVRVNEKNLTKYLGKVKYVQEHANEHDEVGIVRGLAWTSVGGDTLEIEVNVMPGKGDIQLTGQLGDVMKESAQTGMSYIRSVAKNYGIKDEFYKKHDIHIHIPEGAVPKDGPSAGITMATAVLSAITGIPVKADIAMTGEITLRGRVLPIGGLKEKTLAAKMAGIKTVLVPEKNKRDIDELTDEIVDGLNIRFVGNMEEVLKISLVR